MPETPYTYLRLKNRRSTVFVTFKNKDTIAALKQSLIAALELHKDSELEPSYGVDDVRIYERTKTGEYALVADTITADKLHLQNDSVLVYTLRNNGEFEEPEITKPEPLDELGEPEDAEMKPEIGKGKGKGKA